MTIPVGAEMATAVGASISVPGAADLHTMIHAMPESKKVESVAITAGFTDLTVSLTYSTEPS